MAQFAMVLTASGKQTLRLSLVVALLSLLFSSGCASTDLPTDPPPNVAYSTDDYVCADYRVPNYTTWTNYSTIGLVKAPPTVPTSNDAFFVGDSTGRVTSINIQGTKIWDFATSSNVET